MTPGMILTWDDTIKVYFNITKRILMHVYVGIQPFQMFAIDAEWNFYGGCDSLKMRSDQK